MSGATADPEHAEMAEVMLACAGDDVPGGETAGLEAFVRLMALTRPSAIGSAERQLRRYVARPPSRILSALGAEPVLPDVGVPEEDLPDWMTAVADALRERGAARAFPEPGVPDTHWEWRTRFPELAQFLGGWLSQDLPDEFGDVPTAVRDYRAGTHPHLVARLRGEIAELTALGLDESGYALAAADLGMEVAPPPPGSYALWLTGLVEEPLA